MRKTVAMAIGMLIGLYVLSYCVQSFSGYYTPMAYGVYQAPDGGAEVRSKKLGEIWIPFDPDNKTLNRLYFPLVEIDRLIFHRRRPE